MRGVLRSRPARVGYTVDAAGRIVSVERGWMLFVSRNRHCAVIPHARPGRTLWDCFDDAKCRYFYRLLADRARVSQRTLRLPLVREDPAGLRPMQLTLRSRRDGGMDFQYHECPASELVRDRRSARQATRFVRICSWCHRVAVDEDRWVEIEDAVASLPIFARCGLPEFTHSICRDCEPKSRPGEA